MFLADTQDEAPIVRGIVLLKNTSAFHEQEQAEKRRLEQALRTADSESKAKTEFMNRMSHDFRTPIIAMTANAFDEDRKKSNAAGMNAHLAKPLDMQALLSAADRFCR